jgi:hypothetical protein
MIGDKILTHKHVVTLVLALTFTTLACGLASPASTPPTPAPVQPTVPVPTEIPTVPQLTADQLRNAQYQLSARDDHALVQLTDGQYQQGTDITTLDYAVVTLTDFAAAGDLTGDGVNELAVIVFENYGGTGNFAFLTIYKNVDGLPVFLSSAIIDDRPIINGIAVENGEVLLDVITHSFEDPGCCPSLPATGRYVLVNDQLRLTNYTTSTPQDVKRSIEIMTPADGTEVTEFVQVNGAVSVAPFENNLSYFIYNEAGDQLASGPVTVTAPDFGAPGTFSELIPLAGIPAGATVYLEIQDISAANGFILAMDVVKLVVK